jgi:hypothetical protein
LYRITIILPSLQGGFLFSAIFSLMAVGFLVYCFVPPIFFFRVNDAFDVVFFNEGPGGRNSLPGIGFHLALPIQIEDRE